MVVSAHSDFLKGMDPRKWRCERDSGRGEACSQPRAALKIHSLSYMGHSEWIRTDPFTEVAMIAPADLAMFAIIGGNRAPQATLTS